MQGDPLFYYRQPLVTAGGIILGFVLNFATSLVRRDNRSDFIVFLVLVFVFVGITFLIIALYRILNRDYDRKDTAKYYRRSLHFFLTGVILSFFGGLLKVVHTFFLS
jgi:Na+/melibiose symporter-like transporter